MDTVNISPTKSFSSLYDEITKNVGQKFNKWKHTCVFYGIDYIFLSYLVI